MNPPPTGGHILSLPIEDPAPVIVDPPPTGPLGLAPCRSVGGRGVDGRSLAPPSLTRQGWGLCSQSLAAAGSLQQPLRGYLPCRPCLALLGSSAAHGAEAVRRAAKSAAGPRVARPPGLSSMRHGQMTRREASPSLTVVLYFGRKHLPA